MSMINGLREFKADQHPSCKILKQKRHYDVIDHLLDNLPHEQLSRKRMDVPRPVSDTMQFRPTIKVRKGPRAISRSRRKKELELQRGLCL